MEAASRQIVAFTVVLSVLGMMLAVQYRDVTLGGAALFSSMPDIAGAVSRLDAVDAENHRILRQVRVTEQKINKLESQMIQEGGASSRALLLMRSAALLNGSTNVHGPGVTLTIQDGHLTGAAYEQFLTHDWDLRSVVNELFLAGADAVSINQVRITMQTGIFCIGPLIRVGDAKLGPPFVIRAIGNKTLLTDALNLPGGVLDALRAANRGLLVSKPVARADVQIPAAGGMG
ncbi:DUF881 domain-containing protein [Ferroacidibacillus organovorans]|uniref:DUF881 domain-containing protein n=1 Tax=Ferroacidibacillus organovorans TaxID=1765683 RepID=A0A101XQ95_9BACL|nr:DUF881 domain-containing protein [Ferroacidibacillus organovorans]KUO95562.1 hypothetical protein ATW55_06675 [Ferroacidibacillus organovorans]